MRRLGVALALGSVVLSGGQAFAGVSARETHGGRAWRVYVPDGASGSAPLVVMLHGCTQTADAFAEATGMDALADEKSFVVAYPEQTSEMGLNQCFEWWAPENQRRDGGEPEELADGALAIADAHGVDRSRVYVAGLSAGAAMTVILGATHPDRFAAIGVVAGVEFGAATALAGVYAATTEGGPDPKQQGARAYEAMGAHARVVPVLVIHGDADGVVAEVNGEQVAAQWVQTNTLVLGEGSIGAPATTEGEAGYPFSRTVYSSTKSAGSVVEHVLVKGLGHAWPGGKAGGSFSDAMGPSASRMLWAFFEGRSLSRPIPDAPTPELAPEDPAPEEPAPEPGSSPASSAAGCATTPGPRQGAWLLLFFVPASALLRRARRRGR